MIRPAIVLLTLALVATPATAQTAHPADEEAGVRAALQHYLDGHAGGDAAEFEAAFHDVANLYWMADGELRTRSGAEYIEGARSRPGPADDEDRRERRIEMVDVTGDAALARILLDYPGARITDYMSLLKVDGEWKIVNKIFHVQRTESR